MSNGIDTLKEIGAQKIHNDTHISREYAQAIIHETFDGLKSVQFNGFVTILENEYNVDLSDLRAKGKEHFADLNRDGQGPQKVFIIPKKKTDYSFLYKLFGIALFISLVAYTFVYLNSIPDDIVKVDDTKIEQVTKKINSSSLEIEKANVLEANVTEQNNTEASLVAPAVEVEEEIVDDNRSLKILPKRKVWGGLVEIETNKKYQQIFREAYDINTSKNWLLLFGSGTVYLEVNSEVKKFQSNRNMRFKYKDGEFTQITVDEFKSLNKGRKW